MDQSASGGSLATTGNNNVLSTTSIASSDTKKFAAHENIVKERRLRFPLRRSSTGSEDRKKESRSAQSTISTDSPSTPAIQLDSSHEQKQKPMKSRRARLALKFNKLKDSTNGERNSTDYKVAVQSDVKAQPEAWASHSPQASDPKEILPLRMSLTTTGKQAIDREIVSGFEDLYLRLKTWSKLFATEQSVQSLNKPFLQAISGLIPEARKGNYAAVLVDNRNTRRQVVEALTFLVIFRKVFKSFDNRSTVASAAVDLWLPSMTAQSVHLMEHSFAGFDRRNVDWREMHEWRALSITLLARGISDSSKTEFAQSSIGCMASEVLSLFENWCPAIHIDSARVGLEKIIRASILLSCLLRQQQAFWFVSYSTNIADDYENRFDSRFMADVDAGELGSSILTLAISDSDDDQAEEPAKSLFFKIFPGLFKRGNADGLAYEEEDCYVKMRVKCH